MCLVVTCWERADLLALVCGVFCEFVTFPLVSWVRCGTWLYRFLIFAPLLTLIQYHFDYACSFGTLVWLSSFAKKKLQITQNKVISFVLNLDPKSHFGPDEFRSLGWLPISKRVDQIVLNHAFKTNSMTSPDYLTEHLVPTSAIHSYGTRFRENGCLPLPKVNRFGKKTFEFLGCNLWNNLPTNIKSIAHNHSFKVL